MVKETQAEKGTHTWRDQHGERKRSREEEEEEGVDNKS